MPGYYGVLRRRKRSRKNKKKIAFARKMGFLSNHVGFSVGVLCDSLLRHCGRAFKGEAEIIFDKRKFFDTILYRLNTFYDCHCLKLKTASSSHGTWQFVSYADQVTEHFHTQLSDKLLALDSVSIDATSYAMSSGQTWPQVTIPDFAIRGWTTRQLMNAETLGLLPVISRENRQDWEGFVVENHGWISKAHEWESAKEKAAISDARRLSQEVDFSTGVGSSIYTVNKRGGLVVDEGNGPYAPIWMTSPSPRDERMVNYNLLSHHLFWSGIEACMDSRHSVMSKALNLESSSSHRTLTGSRSGDHADPISALLYPVFDSFDERRNLVAVLAAEISWAHFFENSLPSSAGGIIVVVETACNQQFSYLVEGGEATFLGIGDYHDPKFERLIETRKTSQLLETSSKFAGVQMELEHCPFLFNIYPTASLQSEYSSAASVLLTCTLALLLTIVMSILVVNQKSKSHHVGTDSQIPTEIGGDTAHKQRFWKIPRLKKGPRFRGGAAPPHFKTTIRALPERITLSKGRRASLSNATVMFTDVLGVEAWSNGKDPEEISNLMETVHRSLNIIAKRHGIPQVEVSKDSFVVVVGSDDSEVDHATILTYFACDCRKRMSELFKSMSARELSVRFGVHSGHVHPSMIGSGKLEHGEFQLFGETVDTTYQMLTNGKSNRIHLSVETAECLNLAGKAHWISLRSESMQIDGKGNMTTYWVKPKACIATMKRLSVGAAQKSDESVVSASTFNESDWDESSVPGALDDDGTGFQGLVDQNVDILQEHLRAVYARRLVQQQVEGLKMVPSWEEDPEIGVSIIEEAREVVHIPTFDLRLAVNAIDPTRVEIPATVESQLRRFVTSIGSAYRQANAFHTFEHASHVVRSLDRMLKKLSSASEVMVTGFDGKPRSQGDIAKEVDMKTFGIGSDPLVQFSMIFAALVQDVDHMGISNQQLIKESSPIASLYKNRCVSEQNAVDISWWLLMTSDYEDLRLAIYTDTSEMRRFRQCLVNCVIATDVLDRNMKDHRDYNWNKAFVRKTTFMDMEEKRDVQATLMMEFLMQAADSGHCLQSFRSYRKWNELLFEEMYQAYHTGRADVNPTTQWYKAELAYFDKLMIPLLIRLKDSGIFGGFGEAYLKNAVENRHAWKERGEIIVREMMEGFSRRVIAAQEDTISFT
ncbi:MAG: hypothetical protein SGILL_002858 [Bacillariaceae sp.]